MEQDRTEKALAQVAGAGLAAVDSEKAQRQELEKGKAMGAVDVATASPEAAKAWVAATAEAVEQIIQTEKGATTMPARNGTGPMGMGPMAGRGMGVCAAGVVAPASINMTPGRGFGMGCGRGFRGRGAGGRGWRNMFYATGLPAWARRRDHP